MEYLIHIFILIGIFSTLSLSLNLVVGHAGLMSVCQAAFFGIGSYTSALTACRLGLPFSASLIAALCFSALLATLISLPTLRLRGDLAVLGTFGFQMIIFSVLNNWTELTNGPLGVGGIPQITFLNLQLTVGGSALVLSFITAAVTWWLVRCIAGSPFGRVLRAIREDDILTQALAKNAFRFRVVVIAVSAAMAGAAGAFYAHYASYIDPSSFTVMESVFILAMVIVGGQATTWGPVVGAVLLVSLPEMFRFVGMPSAIAANVRQILYGSALVACMMWRPQGLVGAYTSRKAEAKRQ